MQLILWYNPLMLQRDYELICDFVWIVSVTNCFFLKNLQFICKLVCVRVCVLAAQHADGAAQGERGCMQQIIVTAQPLPQTTLFVTEADNSDGFRLKPPQIPSHPAREPPPMSV